ncbi:hypothetical protein [Sphingobium sp. YR657]|uniref:hypothetical protein n=1 Tax=Sphingobium sp. YR657 TaxID=1884366 RepID=UPI0031383692
MAIVDHEGGLRAEHVRQQVEAKSTDLSTAATTLDAKHITPRQADTASSAKMVKKRFIGFSLSVGEIDHGGVGLGARGRALNRPHITSSEGFC